MIKSKFFLIFIIIFNFSAYAENSNPLKLNKLFKELKKTEDIKNANLIEREIWKIWNKHPNNKKLTDKLEFGTELMYEGSYEYALSVFTNVINSDPNWSEPWNKRATLLFLMKKYTNSLNDKLNLLYSELNQYLLEETGKQTYMQYLKKIFRIFKKLDTWVTNQLYEIYPNLTKHMKK